MKVTDRNIEIEKLASDVGYTEASKQLGIKISSVKRICRFIRNQDNNDTEQIKESDKSLLNKLRARYTDEELKFIINGHQLDPTQKEYPTIDFGGEEVCIGFATDTHIGSKFFQDYLWDSFLAECNKQKVDFIIHTGDITEGMSNRPNQIYELEDIGVTAQKSHAERLIQQTDLPIYLIDGNHDRWGIKSNGFFVGEELAKTCDNIIYLGHDMADIDIKGTTWRLWHGEDGSSATTSYRPQKVIDSWDSADMADIMLCGHTHKMISMVYKNVLAVSGGALSFQTSWMKSKRLECHTGFYIIKAKIRDNKIVSFTPIWYPISRNK